MDVEEIQKESEKSFFGISEGPLVIFLLSQVVDELQSLQAHNA